MNINRLLGVSMLLTHYTWDIMPERYVSMHETGNHFMGTVFRTKTHNNSVHYYIFPVGAQKSFPTHIFEAVHRFEDVRRKWEE